VKTRRLTGTEIFAILFLAGSFVFAKPYQVRALNVAPGRIETALKAGEERTYEFLVTNTREEPLIVKVSVRDWSITPEGKVLIEEKEKIPDWIRMDVKELKIEPNVSKKLSFEIALPEKAEGEFRTMFYFQESPEETGQVGLATVIRIGSPVYVAVKGTEKIRGKITNFEILQSTPPAKGNGNIPIKITATFHNYGNVHLRPEITMSIKTKKGKWVKDKEGKLIEITLTKGWPVFPFSDYIIEKEWKNGLKPGKYLAIVNTMFGMLYGKENIISQKREIIFEIK